MENASVFDELHFQKGDGHLNYYLYNWVMKRKHIKPEELAVVLFWSIYLKYVLILLMNKQSLIKLFWLRHGFMLMNVNTF